MSVAVMDLLEVIDVGQQHSDRLGVPPCARQFRGQFPDDRAAIQNARQTVTCRLFHEVSLRLDQLSVPIQQFLIEPAFLD